MQAFNTKTVIQFYRYLQYWITKSNAYSMIKATSFESLILPSNPIRELRILRILWTLPAHWQQTINQHCSVRWWTLKTPNDKKLLLESCYANRDLYSYTRHFTRNIFEQMYMHATHPV